MNTNAIGLLFSLLLVTLMSGYADSQGFIHAAEIWQGDRLSWLALTKSASGFGIGIALYWYSLRYMHKLGIVAPETQTVIWFTVTLIGVAVTSGRFSRWPWVEQFVAIGIVSGLAWLLFRSSVST